MTNSYDPDIRHRNALEKLERSAELTQQRQQETEARKERTRTQATLIEGANAKELMELQHELNKENRLLDHQFALAEDSRELERQAIDISMRRRDDHIRHMWNNDSTILELELKLIEKMMDGKTHTTQSVLTHEQAKELATHHAALEKELLRYKQDLALEYSRKSGEVSREAIEAHLQHLFARGALPKPQR